MSTIQGSYTPGAARRCTTQSLTTNARGESYENPSGTPSAIGPDGVLLTNLTASLTVAYNQADAYGGDTGVAVLTETAMSYVAPGWWRYDVPESPVFAGATNLTEYVRIYDVSGTTLLYTAATFLKREQ